MQLAQRRGGREPDSSPDRWPYPSQGDPLFRHAARHLAVAAERPPPMAPSPPRHRLEWVTPHTARKTVASLIDKEADAETRQANSATKHYIVKPTVAPTAPTSWRSSPPGRQNTIPESSRPRDHPSTRRESDRARAFPGGFRGRNQTPIDDHEALTGVAAGQGLIYVAGTGFEPATSGL